MIKLEEKLNAMLATQERLMCVAANMTSKARTSDQIVASKFISVLISNNVKFIRECLLEVRKMQNEN